MSHQRLCIIPARGGSKRLPLKNIRLLAGKPMVVYTIEAALQSEVFDEVCVSTESEEIAEVARQCGAEVPFMRPPELAADDVGVVHVCLHALDFYVKRGMKFNILGVLLPSSPLRTGEDIRGAHEKFLSADADFLMAVTDYIYSPFQALHERNGHLRPFWDPLYYRKRRQDLPKVVVDNGAIYLMYVEAFRRERIFYGERLTGFHMPFARSVDVDDWLSLELAEFFLDRQQKGVGKE